MGATPMWDQGGGLVRLGRYELGAILGSGGMGEVYRARDVRLGREVAIKILRQALASDAERVRRFETEARAVGQLDHPNILSVHDVGTEDGAPYLVTELLSGETLKDRLSGGPLEPDRAIAYASQIADGLAAAHARGVIHRDLKPANLFVTSDGRIKILDFGLAKLTAPEPLGHSPSSMTLQETETGTLMGTADYMSPEQIRAVPIDARSDVFALGTVFFEMLTGRPPFHCGSIAETMVAIVHADPDMSRLPAACPESVRILLRRCLEKSPEARLQSARDVAFALTDVRHIPAAERRVARRAPRIALIVLGAASLVLALVLVVRSNPPPSPKPIEPRQPIRSIAILPMRNLSTDRSQEFFADGMTDALITTLAKVGRLRVISRTSIMRFKQSPKPLSAIANELGADAVVEGTVQRSGSRVRITARLIEAAGERMLWAESYDREAREVLAIQSEIGARIAEEIQIQLTGPERARLGQTRPVDPAVYDEYLQGLYQWNRRTPDSLSKAISHLERAIAGDPEYAPAHAALADCYNLLGSVETAAMPPRVAMPRAKQLALRALALDSSLASAYASLGHCQLFYDWDWSGAEASFRKAIDLDPSYAPARQWYGFYLMMQGRMDESIREGQQARLLDPLSLILQASLGTRYFFARDYEGAIRLYLQVLALDESFALAHFYVARAYLQTSRIPEALVHYRRAVTLSNGSPAIQGFLGHALARAGKAGEARRILRDLEAASQRRYVPAQAFCLIHAGLGDREKAISWLRRVYEERSPAMVYLLIDPLGDDYRSDPRVAELLRNVRSP